MLAEACVFLDFSHSKPVGRANAKIPHLSPIWHDPAIMQPPAPARNVVALSEWQAERFRRIQKQECRVLDPIAGDADYFIPSQEPRGDYLLFIGKLAPDKGCVQAIQACRELKQRLEIVGPVTPGDPPGYVAEVLRQCDGRNIVYHGEVTEAHKLALLQGAKALLYPVSYLPGFGEAHSHKAAEAMLCGLPCIAYDQGAMNEVVDQGVTGLVISGRAELAEAIRACETLDRARCRERALERWDYRNVVSRWLPVMEQVTKGARW
jgi:glycosyltransferase involved in cell wall biosynthesis